MMGFTDKTVIEYIDSYYRPIDEDLAELRRVNELNNVPLILRETEGFLSLLLDIVRPSHILEIGTAYGYSAVFFAKKMKNARITTIERSPHMIEAAERTFASRKEGDRIDLRTGDALEILDSMISDSRSGSSCDDMYDFVFIDAGKSHYREFLERAEKLLVPGSIIVCDNILMHGWMVSRTIEGSKRHRTNVKYMRQFIEYIEGRDDLSVSLLSSGDGLAVIRYNE